MAVVPGEREEREWRRDPEDSKKERRVKIYLVTFANLGRNINDGYDEGKGGCSY